MRFLRYIAVPWTFLLVYTFFSGVLGQNGLYAKKHLESEYLRLIEHERVLENANRSVLTTRNNLMHDPDTLAVYARQLGYGIGNEKFVRIRGLSVAMNGTIPDDKVLYAVEPGFVSDNMIKIISVFFGAAVLIFLLINDFYVFKELFSSK